MEIRKVVAGTAMAGLLGAGALGMAGNAFAKERPSHNNNDDKKSSISVKVNANKKATTTIKNSQVGSGNTNPSATDSGNITSNQNGLGLSAPTSLQLNPKINLSGASSGAASTGNAKKGGKNEAETDAKSSVTQKDKQVVNSTGQTNDAYNESHVNTTVGNGNLSPVIISTHQ